MEIAISWMEILIIVIKKISLRLITCDMPAKHVLLRESECWGERKLLVTAPKWATQVAANRSRH